MNNTFKTALGGMCIALSTAVMLASSILPYFTYALPAMAALLVFFVAVECGRKWGLAVYVGTAIISALIVPGKEAVGMYIALIGYYPLVKPFFDKPKKAIVSVIIKIVFFTVDIIAAYSVMIFVFGISTEMLEESERYLLPIVLILGIAAFVLYDRALMLFEIAYYRKWQRTVRKFFRKR